MEGEVATFGVEVSRFGVEVSLVGVEGALHRGEAHTHNPAGESYTGRDRDDDAGEIHSMFPAISAFRI